MHKTLLLSASLCTLCLFSACAKNNTPVLPLPNEVEIVTEEKIDGLPLSDYITTEKERITITSLAVWDEFNHDGNFSDNCLQFLRNFIENDSEYLEFNTVKVSDWEIIRDPEVYDYYSLAFNFTVTESALDTLPVGTYRTLVEDKVDCYMHFADYDPTAVETVPHSNNTDTVRDWISSALRWEMPEYGKSTEPERYINYIVKRYGKDGIMLFDDFQERLSAVAGISVVKEDCEPFLCVQDARLCIREGAIGGNASYACIADTAAEGHSVVTVQFFADCNRFIRSMQVEYRIGDDGKLLGSTVIEKSPYAPYGLRP